MKNKEIILLIGALVVMLCPFLNRPFYIDDYYHFLMAKGIVENPLRPYDFLADDAGPNNAGWERGHPPRMVNPPLMHYYLAGIIKLFGQEIWKLHLAFMIFPVLSVISMYLISKLFLNNYLSATLLFMVNPIFWVTSNAFMLDSPKLTFYLLSLLFLFYGLKRDKKSLLFLSGLSMGLAILSKYTALTIIPVALLYIVLTKNNWFRYIWFFLIPVAIVFLWSVWNFLTYGQPHIVAAFSRGATPPSFLPKTVAVLTFLSGGTIFLLTSFWFNIKDKLAVLSSVSLFVFFVYIFSSDFGGFSLTQSVLLSLFLIMSVNFLYSIAKNIKLFKSKNDIFLVGWLSILLLSLVLVMWWTSGRYFMSLLAPLSIVFIKLSDGFRSNFGRKVFINLTVFITFFGGLSLAYTDYIQAAVNIKIARDIKTVKTDRGYFKGESFIGVSAYLKEAGWKTVFPESILKVGDYFLEGTISSPTVWMFPPKIEGKLRYLRSFEYRSWIPLRIMSVPASAGFYASCWGALPWSVSRLPIERYNLYVVE